MARASDALLDEYGRLLKALQVLHLEADTDLPYDEWVDLAAVRHTAWANRISAREHDIAGRLPKYLCPEDGCVAEYAPVGEPRFMGTDDQGKAVYFRKWECAAGHWHTIPED